MNIRHLVSVSSLMLVVIAGCRGSEPASPATASPDAGSTSTTGGVIEDPNSPGMTNSGTPNPPGRGDPPQVLPPELGPR